MKTNFMGKCYAGMNSMVTGMKRSSLNWKQDGKAAEAEKTIHTMTREIGNLTVVTLVIVVLTLRGLILFRLGRACRRPFGRKRGRHEVY